MSELHSKRIGAYAILLNEKGQVLSVKTVDGHWILPGGMVENDESPKRGCAREVKEELGLDIELGEPLFIGYHNFSSETKELVGATDLVWFALGSGVLSTSQINEIKLQEDELTEYQFTDLEKLPSLVIDELKYVAETISSGLAKGQLTYIEDS